MAGIDKTYVTCWEDYKAAYDWAKSVGTVKDDFGNIFVPFDWLSEWEEAEFKESIKEQKERYKKYYSDPIHLQEAKEMMGEDWEPESEGIGEIMLWNTPTYFDIWLIRNCPLGFIQDRLQEQYGEEYVALKERRSEYDLFVRPAASSHFTTLPAGFFPRSINRSRYYYIDIQVDGMDWNYDDETGEWHHWLECRRWNTNTMTISGPITRRKFKRIIKKCGFPAGTKLICSPNYGESFEVVIKK